MDEEEQNVLFVRQSTLSPYRGRCWDTQNESTQQQAEATTAAQVTRKLAPHSALCAMPCAEHNRAVQYIVWLGEGTFIRTTGLGAATLVAGPEICAHHVISNSAHAPPPRRRRRLLPINRLPARLPAPRAETAARRRAQSARHVAAATARCVDSATRAPPLPAAGREVSAENPGKAAPTAHRGYGNHTLLLPRAHGAGAQARPDRAACSWTAEYVFCGDPRQAFVDARRSVCRNAFRESILRYVPPWRIRHLLNCSWLTRALCTLSSHLPPAVQIRHLFNSSWLARALRTLSSHLPIMADPPHLQI